MKYRILHDITCFEDEFKKGDIVYRYSGCTYGCISNEGIACTIKKDETPFIEIPKEELEEIEEKDK